MRAGVARDVGQSAEQVDYAVKSGKVLERPAPPESGQGHINNVGPQLLHLVVAQAQVLHDSRSVVLDQDIADGDDALGQLDRLRVAQVEAATQLVAVDQVEAAAPVDSELAVSEGRARPGW